MSVETKIDLEKMRGRFQTSALIAESDSNLGLLSLLRLQAASPLPQFATLSLASANTAAIAESERKKELMKPKSFLAAG